MNPTSHCVGPTWLWGPHIESLGEYSQYAPYNASHAYLHKYTHSLNFFGKQ